MSTSNRTIKDEVRLLGTRKHPMTYEKMVGIIKERHPEAHTTVKTVQWYASRLRREGVEVHVKDGRTLAARKAETRSPRSASAQH